MPTGKAFYAAAKEVIRYDQDVRRHLQLELPGEADLEQMEVELHKHFLEIRAPVRAT